MNAAAQWARDRVEITRDWLEANPRAALALVPFVGMPRSLERSGDRGLWAILKLTWPLLIAAACTWSNAYSQGQSYFLGLVEGQVIEAQGRVHFETLRSYMAPIPFVIFIVAILTVIISAAFQNYFHRVNFAITKWSWREKPLLDYKYHLIQVASVAMYCGTAMTLIGFLANHWGVAEPWVRRFVNSELILIPATCGVVAGHFIRKRRSRVANEVYGSRPKAFIASIVSLCFSFVVLGLAILFLGLLRP